VLLLLWRSQWFYQHFGRLKRKILAPKVTPISGGSHV
jgi:hypothetical protein